MGRRPSEDRRSSWVSKVGSKRSLRLPPAAGVESERRFAEEACFSNTAGPEASDQDESQPEPRDIENPEGGKKAVPGVEIGMMPEGQGSTFEPEEDREPQG
jgi:hypothetical protein